MKPLVDQRNSTTRTWALRALYLLCWPVLIAPRTLRVRKAGSGPVQVYFFHIRKTAGTSLTRAFAAAGGEPADVVIRRLSRLTGSASSGPFHYLHRGDTMIAALSPFTFGWSHVPSWRFRLPRSAHRVTILRDPVVRVRSLYAYLADPSAHADAAFPAHPALRELASDGFDSFLRRAPRELLLNQLFMFSPSLDPAEAAATIQGLDTWFFTESYATGIEALASRAGVRLEVRTERRSAPVEAVDPDAENLLRELLAPEYVMINILRSQPGSGFVGSFPEPPFETGRTNTSGNEDG